MRLTMSARLARFALAAGLVLSLAAPAAGPVAAADPVVLKLGTTQAIDSVNPYQSALVESYEAFELSYDQLVSFGPDLEPVPGVRRVVVAQCRRQGLDLQVPTGPEVVRRAAGDRPTTRASRTSSGSTRSPRMRASDSATSTRAIKDAGVTKVECPDPLTILVDDDTTRSTSPPDLRPDPAQARLGEGDLKPDRRPRFRGLRRTSRLVGTGPYQVVEWTARRVRPVRAQPELLGQAGLRGRGDHPVFS